MLEEELFKLLQQCAQEAKSDLDHYNQYIKAYFELGTNLTGRLQKAQSDETLAKAALYIGYMQQIGLHYFEASESARHPQSLNLREISQGFYRQTIPLCQALKNKAAEAQAWLGSGLASDHLINRTEGHTALEKAISLYQSLNDKPNEARAYQKLGQLYFTDNQASAYEYTRQALALFNEAGLSNPEVAGLARLVQTMEYSRKMLGAMEQLDQKRDSGATIDFMALRDSFPSDNYVEGQPFQNTFSQLLQMTGSMLDRMQNQQEIERLNRNGKAALPDLIEKLQTNPDPLIRMKAAQTLANLEDPQAFAPLLQCVQVDKEGFVRMAATQALVQLQAPHGFETLKALLGMEYVEIVAAAAGALGRLKDERAFEPLKKLFEKASTTPDLKGDVGQSLQQLAYSLAELGDKRAFDPLVATLKTTDTEVRYVLIEALEHLGDQRAIEPLTQLLNDPEEEIQDAAARAISQLRGESLDEDAVRDCIGNLESAEPAGYEAIIAKFADPNTKSAIIRLLQLLDNADTLHSAHSHELGTLVEEATLAHFYKIKEDAIPVLLEVLDSPVRSLAEQATFVLGKSGDAQVVEPLLAILDQPDHPAYRRSFRALADLGQPRAVGPLVKLLMTPNAGKKERKRQLQIEGIRGRAALALLGLGAIEPLLKALEEKDNPVLHQDVIMALARSPQANDERIINILEKIKREDTNVTLHGARVRDLATYALNSIRQIPPGENK